MRKHQDADQLEGCGQERRRPSCGYGLERDSLPMVVGAQLRSGGLVAHSLFCGHVTEDGPRSGEEMYQDLPAWLLGLLDSMLVAKG